MAAVDLRSLVGKYIRLPATVWGEEWAKENHGSSWKTHFDVCRITKHFPRKSGYHESLEFQFNDGSKYSMTAREARDYHKKGLFQGTLIHIPTPSSIKYDVKHACFVFCVQIHSWVHR